MSFVWQAPQRTRTPEQVAKELLEVAREKGLNDFAAVLATMCVAAESNFWNPANEGDPSSKNYDHDSLSDDGRSVSYFQQQNGRAGDTLPAGDRDNWWGPMSSRMDLRKSAGVFYDRLTDDYMNAVNNPVLAGQFVQGVQGSAFKDGSNYRVKWDQANRLVREAKGEAGPVVPEPTFRPDFNEYEVWSPSSQDRRGTKVDLFLLHTQEGNGTADSLAQWLGNPNNNVSYHYTISEDREDHGVTVCDVVDTDLASWSVLSANNRSINLCFAGSSASWSRADWLKQSKAIDVAAYLAAQDCVKYKIKPWVILPPYNADPPGVSDHRYVTRRLNDGTHTDVGGPMAPPWTGFPWDMFDTAFHAYYEKFTGVAAPPVLTPPPAMSDRQLLQEVWDQLRGPGGKGWPQLNNKSLVDAVAELLKKEDGK
jgi:N-acetyl-anhydromuramyl-L-alanine amidase AmpD